VTADDIKRVVDEVERRWRERTPATRVDEVNASYRVGRGEIRTWCTVQGIELDEMDEGLEVALLRMYVGLRREFPNEMWDHANARMKETAIRHKIVIPRVRRKVP
jgi:hypothetical protein